MFAGADSGGVQEMAKSALWAREGHGVDNDATCWCMVEERGTFVIGRSASCGYVDMCGFGAALIETFQAPLLVESPPWRVRVASCGIGR